MSAASWIVLSVLAAGSACTASEALKGCRERGTATGIAVAVVLLVASRCPGQPQFVAVAVTLQDLGPIVQAVGGNTVRCTTVMPPGADPHSFSLSHRKLQELKNAALIVYANTNLLHFEARIKQSFPNKPSLDWPDYQVAGARLKDFSGYPSNPHGFWLDLNNGLAIACAVGKKLEELGLPEELIAQNLAEFEQEITSAGQRGRRMVQLAGLEGATYVLAVPGVAYSVHNLGLEVGSILLGEGAGLASGRMLSEVTNKLRSGQWRGIVCPESMRPAKAGQIARQLARDSGSTVYYVRFLGGKRGYTDQALYNTHSLTSTPPQKTPGAETAQGTDSGWVYGLALAVIVITVVLVVWGRQRYQRKSNLTGERPVLPQRDEHSGAGIFEDDEQNGC